MNFFKLSTDEGKRKKFAYGIHVGEYPKKTIKCSSCHREWDKGLFLEDNTILTFALTNEYYPDFLYSLYIKLISEKAKEVLLEENVQGYHLGMLKLIPKSHIPQQEIKKLRRIGYKVVNFSDCLPNYYRLLVDRSAELHPKSDVVLEAKCDDCGYKKYKKEGDPLAPEYIKKDSWNGDDLFMVKEFGAAIYCSERFVEIYEKHKLTGLRFKPVESL